MVYTQHFISHYTELALFFHLLTKQVKHKINGSVLEEIRHGVSQNYTANLKHGFQTVLVVLDLGGLELCSEVKTVLIAVKRYPFCCTITGNISSEKSLAHSDYFHDGFPPPPAKLLSSHVGLFTIQHAFYSSSYQGCILCLVFSSILS